MEINNLNLRKNKKKEFLKVIKRSCGTCFEVIAED
jgi:hypothetical protein